MRRVASPLTLVLSVILGACTSPRIVPIPIPPELPAEWGKYSQEYWEGTNCPKVAGAYLQVPSIYEVGEDGEAFLEGSDISFYSLFALHRASESLKDYQDAQVEPKTLVLEQVGDSNFVLKHFAPEIEKSVRYEYVKSEGDFDCVDGFIQFPVSGHYGMIEGMTLNGQVVRKFKLTGRGDLISILSSGPYRSRRAADKLDFVHEFYLFKRM